MQKEREALETLTLTLKKYKANKEKVDPEELKTKYAKSFDKLCRQLKEETGNYFTIVMLDGMLILNDREKETLDAIVSDLQKNNVGKKAGKAVFKNYDLQELKDLALEQRRRNLDIILSHEGGIRA